MAYRNEDGGLYKLFKENIKGVLLSKIETGVTAPGFPDAVMVAPGGVVAFLEFKNYTGKLRPMQIAWLKKCALLGGRAFVVVRKKDDLYVYKSGTASQKWNAEEGGGHWSGGPKGWDWGEVFHFIVER